MCIMTEASKLDKEEIEVRIEDWVSSAVKQWVLNYCCHNLKFNFVLIKNIWFLKETENANSHLYI